MFFKKKYDQISNRKSKQNIFSTGVLFNYEQHYCHGCKNPPNLLIRFKFQLKIYFFTVNIVSKFESSTNKIGSSMIVQSTKDQVLYE